VVELPVNAVPKVPTGTKLSLLTKRFFGFGVEFIIKL